MQAASLWADKIGDRDSAADVYERVLQLDAQQHDGVAPARAALPPRKSWEEADRAAPRAHRVHGRRGGAHRAALQVAEIYEKQLNDHDSAFVTLQAAFRENYSNDHVAKELERLATATNKWNELIGEYTQVVQGIADPKQAADLWVKIARWYG